MEENICKSEIYKWAQQAQGRGLMVSQGNANQNHIDMPFCEIQKKKITSIGEDGERLESLSIDSGKSKMGSHSETV